MPIEDKLRTELVGLAKKPGQNELLGRLFNVLQEKKLNREDLFEFFNRIWTKSKQKVADPETIYQLGLKIYKEPELKELSPDLYKLAADRGHGMAANYYARRLFTGRGVAKNLDEALKYADMAIANKVDCHFTRAEVLWEQDKYLEAIAAYKKVSITSEPGKETDWDKCKKEVGSIIEGLEEDLDDSSEDLQRIATWAEALIDFRDDTIANKAILIAGKAHFKLGDYPKAMQYFVKIPKDAIQYEASIPFRKECYVKNIAENLGISADLEEGEIPVAESEESEGEAASEAVAPVDPKIAAKLIQFPDGVSGHPAFGRAWVRRAELYDMHDSGMHTSIRVKWREAITEVDEALGDEKTALGKRKRRYETLGLLTKGEDKEKELAAEVAVLGGREAAFTREIERFDAMEELHGPAKRVRLRRAQAEKRFFDPRRSKKPGDLLLLSKQILEARFQQKAPAAAASAAGGSGGAAGGEVAAEPIPSITLTGLNARRLITAERAFQEAGVALLEPTWDPRNLYVALGIPLHSARRPERGGGPRETYTIGSTSVACIHDIEPSRNRLGNSILPDHGSYTALYQSLCAISKEGKEAEKQLARLMIRYGHDFKPASLEELQEINSEVTQPQADTFNQICLLITAKEQSQWMSSKGASYHTGLAVAQARCLILIREGYLSFKECFSLSATYGVFSQQYLLRDFEKVEAAIENVERLYTEYLKHHKFQSELTFLMSHPGHQLTLSRRQAHRDLKEVYGGESDTDGEGYDTELSV